MLHWPIKHRSHTDWCALITNTAHTEVLILLFAFFFLLHQSVEIYTKETLVGTSYVEEQKCGGDAARLVTPKPGE